MKYYVTDQPEIYPIGLAIMHMNVLLIILGYDIEEKPQEKDKVVVQHALKSAMSDVKIPLIQLQTKDVQ